MTTLALALFDIDGTLVDSQRMIIAAMAAAFRADGRPAPAAPAVRHVVGLTLEDAMARLLPEAGAEGWARLAEGYKRAFTVLRARGEHDEPLFPGAAAALTRLRARGFLLGVATGKSRRGATATLETHGLGDLFDTLQTSDGGPGKPHPAMVERAMAETGAARARTVLIGDTTFDIEMALAAGVTALGVAWGYHPARELTAAGARHVLGSFDDLDRAIDGLLGSMAVGPSGDR